MPALISNDLRVSKMGGYWAGSATDVQTMTKALSALGCRERSMAQTYRARLNADPLKRGVHRDSLSPQGGEGRGEG